MSALPPKADIAEHRRHVRFVPVADIRQLFEYMVSDREVQTGRPAGSVREEGVGESRTKLALNHIAVPNVVSPVVRKN